MTRDIQATAVVDEREHRLLKAAARASGESMSSFIRAASLAAAVDVLKQDQQDEEEAQDGSAVDG